VGSSSRRGRSSSSGGSSLLCISSLEVSEALAAVSETSDTSADSKNAEERRSHLDRGNAWMFAGRVSISVLEQDLCIVSP